MCAIPDCLDLQDTPAYLAWREQKLANYPVLPEQLLIAVKDAQAPSSAEISRMRDMLARYNMVFYTTPDKSENRTIPLQLCQQFGLKRLDGNLGAGVDAVTEIEVKDGALHGRYIPYSSNKLNWHTDGYYNAPKRQIRAMALHCVRPSGRGGENQLLDVELAYIYLRDLSRDYIRALFESDVMTIPANIVDGQVLRKSQSGPVFSVDARGQLHMRYTARKRSIEWKQTFVVSEAVAALDALLTERDRGWILRHTLSAGEGLICNNVLHNRTAFEDDPEAPRLLYRLRYLERCRPPTGG